MGYALFAAAYVIGYALLGWALADHPIPRVLASGVLLIIPPLGIALVILRRRHEWLGCQRLFWDAFAIGMALWAVGHVGWMSDAVGREDGIWIEWHTIFSLCGGIGPLVALLARPHLGVRASSAGAVSILIASYALLALFIYSYFVLVPGLLPRGPGANVMLLTLVQGNRLLLVLGMAAGAWAAWRTDWRRTYLILATGAFIGFFLRIVTSFAIAQGTYRGGSVLDLAWLIPFLIFLGAALHAPPSRLEFAEAPGPSAVAAAIPVCLIPVIGYSLLFLQPLGATGDSVRALLTGLLTVGGLGLLTARLFSQSGALQRADTRSRLLAAAIEQTGDGIVITRADGTIEHANDAFLRTIGCTRQDLTMPHPELRETALELCGPRVFEDVQRDGCWRGTLVRRRRDGSAFHSACTVVALRDANDRITHFVHVERDVTDDLKLRDQLVHAERLSAIGALVAGLAHEINNPLQTILGNAEMLLDDERMASAHRDIDIVRREASRAAQIVRNLLAFVRRSSPDRKSIDLNEIVRSTLELRQYHLERNNVTLEVALHEAPLPVLVNREEIQQIVLNLILNAEQAIDSTGHRGSIRLRTFSLGSQHCVEVADDGPGISRELRGKIFEPFFTTKDVGEGTGLGLSISHGIAFAHGGSLDLVPDEGPGACFRVTLPADVLVEPEAEVLPRAESGAPRIALVVDDELPIRKLLSRLLERRGFVVLEADSGEAALPLALNRQPGIILCDVRMPGMGGVGLYSQVPTELRRRFVFMSGDSSQVRNDGITDHVPLLRKPFSAADLDALLTKAGL